MSVSWRSKPFLDAFSHIVLWIFAGLFGLGVGVFAEIDYSLNRDLFDAWRAIFLAFLGLSYGLYTFKKHNKITSKVVGCLIFAVLFVVGFLARSVY